MSVDHTMDPRARFALAIRAREVRLVAPLLRPGPKVILEIGGGNGWQALLLSHLGHRVVSIDIRPAPRALQHHPVLPFDGVHLPFPDRTFDTVFSSNVLEHIADLAPLDGELRRVLKPSGQAIHVLPTPTWRIATLLTYHIGLLAAVLRLTEALAGRGDRSRTAPNPHVRWYHALWPARHGEKGNALTEIFWFSQFRWTNLFSATGWRVLQVNPTGLFYTGHLILNARLSTPHRRTLARYFGSSTRIYRLTHDASVSTGADRRCRAARRTADERRDRARC